MGTGHTTRCLALAGKIRESGDQTVFVTRDLPGNIADLIRREGHQVLFLPAPSSNQSSKPKEINPLHTSWLGVSWKEDAEQSARAISQLQVKVSWLIIDHYALDARWEKKLRPLVEKMLVIDDLADRQHHADMLLDQNLYDGMDERYIGRISKRCMKLLGPKYALLRPEFRTTRESLRQRDGRIKNILVFFGGSDPTNETTKTLNALSTPEFLDLEIDVVIGGSNLNRERINEYCRKLTNCRCYFNIDYMASLMSKADLFIGSGGTSTWERCCLGLPSIIIAVANNQEEISRNIATKKLGIYLGTPEEEGKELILKAVKKMIKFPELGRGISEKSMKLVDGKGTSRVADVMMKFPGTMG